MTGNSLSKRPVRKRTLHTAAPPQLYGREARFCPCSRATTWRRQSVRGLLRVQRMPLLSTPSQPASLSA